jgi:hypothetical protein
MGFCAPTRAIFRAPRFLRGSFSFEPGVAYASARRRRGHPAAALLAFGMSLVRPAGGGLTCWDVPRPDKF